MKRRQDVAVPHEKCCRKRPVPHIENGAQITIRVLEGLDGEGGKTGYTMEEKQKGGPAKHAKTCGDAGIQAPVSKGDKKNGLCLTNLRGSPAATGSPQPYKNTLKTQCALMCVGLALPMSVPADCGELCPFRTARGIPLFMVFCPRFERLYFSPVVAIPSTK